MIRAWQSHEDVETLDEVTTLHPRAPIDSAALLLVDRRRPTDAELDHLGQPDEPPVTEIAGWGASLVIAELVTGVLGVNFQNAPTSVGKSDSS